MIRAYTCIDGFCGAGGLALGLRRAGFEVLISFDTDECAVRTFKQNVSPQCLQEKAEDLTAERLFRKLDYSGPLDLFSGGPPCQGFSKQKRGAHLGDDRNELVLHFARLVRETQPRFFLMENVDQLGKKRGKGFVDKIHSELADYELYPNFYNSADYGVAQTRVRFVVVGKVKSVNTPFHTPPRGSARWVTVGEALQGIPEPPLDYTEHPDFPNHYRARVTPINIERFSHVPQGGAGRTSRKISNCGVTRKLTVVQEAGQTSTVAYSLTDKHRPLPPVSTVLQGAVTVTRPRIVH